MLKKWLIVVFLLSIYPVFFVLKNVFFPINQKPEKTDVIIVLSGDFRRLEKGYDLYKSGYSDHIMLSNSNSGLFKSEFRNLYLSSDADYFIHEPNASSTYTNAYYTLKLMKKYKFKSAIVVSSYYHMSRAKLTYDRVFKDTGIQLTYVTSYTPSIKNERRWIKSLIYAFREPYYYLGYYLKLYKWIDI